MFAAKQLCALPGLSLALAAIIGLTGCAGPASSGTRRGWQPEADCPASAVEVGAAQSLKEHLKALAPSVREDEAQLVAVCAYEYSRQLGRQYRVVRPAVFHNFLVNLGVKRRGLCYQWAEDLLAQLQTFNLQSLELRWGIARANTSREHNCVVVTAPGQPFERGIVLDAWRRGGRLVWSPVATDRYPWVEGELTPSP
jgi:hypothetical protein